MTEKNWITDIILQKLELKFDEKYQLEQGSKLIYAYEITEYKGTDSPKKPEPKRYETDILISEYRNGNLYKPRVVIEVKKQINTHEAIAYNQKAMNHKLTHPYLRYGILIRESKGIPGRLSYHGNSFDFIFSWSDYNPKNNELKDFVDLIKKELKNSEDIETLGNSGKYMIHKNLIVK